MKAVIFLGPTMPVEAAREILDAVYLPPAAQADILSAVHTHRPDVIGLIDGVFGQSLSVWHKEILYALHRGVRVFGASSMGALRAAETAEFGMVGVGEIYEMYRSGALTDDDEVVLLHGPADYGYRGLTLPMINVRATLRRACDEGVVDEDTGRLLTDLAKAVFYGDRTVAEMRTRWLAAGVEEATCARTAAFFASSYVDLKRRDAEKMLALIADGEVARATPSAAFTFERSYLFNVLDTLDRKVCHDGVEVSFETIAKTAALHQPDFLDMGLQAANRRLVALLAGSLDVTVSEADITHEERRFRRRRNLESDTDYDVWRMANDIDAGEMRALLREVALCRAMQRWLSARMFLERNTGLVLDELRLRDRYVAAARHAAAVERAACGENGELSIDESTDASAAFDALFVEHVTESECQIDTGLSEWMEEAGFRSKDELRAALLRARAFRSAPTPFPDR
ncbi:MAG: hypothetical protein EB084_03195 [Proteobacteria bacterium]|nr:hypothetical protein [Pseudomonadota bacterium]